MNDQPLHHLQGVPGLQPGEVRGRFWRNVRGQVVAWFEDGSMPFETRFTCIGCLLKDIGWNGDAHHECVGGERGGSNG